MKITLPYEVAKSITIGAHPVTAWRNYYGISIEELAACTLFSTNEIEKIESSNLHLAEKNSETLAKAFNIYVEAIKIRYVPH